MILTNKNNTYFHYFVNWVKFNFKFWYISAPRVFIILFIVIINYFSFFFPFYLRSWNMHFSLSKQKIAIFVVVASSVEEGFVTFFWNHNFSTVRFHFPILTGSINWELEWILIQLYISSAITLTFLSFLAMSLFEDPSTTTLNFLSIPTMFNWKFL